MGAMSVDTSCLVRLLKKVVTMQDGWTARQVEQWRELKVDKLQISSVRRTGKKCTFFHFREENVPHGPFFYFFFWKKKLKDNEKNVISFQSGQIWWVLHLKWGVEIKTSGKVPGRKCNPQFEVGEQNGPIWRISTPDLTQRQLRNPQMRIRHDPN